MSDIESLDGISELIRTVREGQETIFDLLDEGGEKVKTIEIKRRQLRPEQPEQLPEADIARAKARSHVFNCINTFSDYLTRWGDKEKSIVLADVNSRTITAVLDESDDCDRETVTLKAIEHPLFTPWAKILSRTTPVIEFALFVMEHRRAIAFPDGRELAMVFSQVKMSKAIQMHSGVGKKSLNGVMVEMEISGERKGVPVELPETIKVQLPLFVGTEPQDIEIDLLVTNRGEEVIVYATAADVEEQRINAFNQVVEMIREQTGHLVGLGQVQNREWNTVPRFAR